MVSSLSAADQRFLTTLGQIQDRLNKATEQVSSGRRINSASDYPDDVSAVLTARANLEQTLQIQKNLSAATTEASTADKAISNAIDLFDKLNSVAAQGSTETATPDTRKTLGTEVDALLSELVSTADTQVGSRYIFSGDSDQLEPFSLVSTTNPDGTITNTVSGYQGTPATRQLMHPNGTTFDVSMPGDKIFDLTGASAFQAVQDLRDALNNGPTVPSDDPAYQSQYSAQTDAINSAIDELKSARTNLASSLAFYGVVENRIDEATSYASTQETTQKQQLSSVQDVDETTAILDLQTAMNQQSAALQARAKIPQKSLFDYL